VFISFPTQETTEILLQKAEREALALSTKVPEESTEEKPVEKQEETTEEQKEETTEETKAEENKEENNTQEANES